MLHAVLLLATLHAVPVVHAPEVPRLPAEVVRDFLAVRHAEPARLRELVADDVIWEGTGVEVPRVGLAALIEMLQSSEGMMPDARYEVVSVAADGEHVFAETLTAGTIRAAPKGAPSSVVGRYVNLRTVNVFEVHEGRIHHVSAYFDIIGFWRQLGLKK